MGMELKFILESVLFSAQKPLSPQELRGVLVAAAEPSEDAAVRALKRTGIDAIEGALELLREEHEAGGRSYRLACVAGSWQFVSEGVYGPWVRVVQGNKARPSRLSQAALETLAIIAYRQPATRAEIEQVRGVAVDGVMQTLVERGLVEQAGRAEVAGRPAMYATTASFLEYFGLRSLEDLPGAEELRRIAVHKPDSLMTVDPGLATTPPEALTIPADAETSREPEAAAAAASAGGEAVGSDVEKPASSSSN